MAKVKPILYGRSEQFEVKEGLHQGSALSTLLSIIIMDVLARKLELNHHGQCYSQMTWCT